MGEPLKPKPITLYHHTTKSWLSCYDDYCDTHRSEKEDAGYFPKKLKGSKYPLSDDCHLQHAQVGWRNCQDPYCITHLAKKMSELSIEKPDDYDETLERRWLERTEDSKENDPRWRRVLDEQASEEEGTPVTKWVRVDREDERLIEKP